jgi:hypothetical protein
MLVAAAAAFLRGADNEIEANRGACRRRVCAGRKSGKCRHGRQPSWATTSSVPGAVLFDDFDSVQNTAIGTITGGFYAPGATLVAADYLERPQPPGISSGWLVLTARRQLPR